MFVAEWCVAVTGGLLVWVAGLGAGAGLVTGAAALPAAGAAAAVLRTGGFLA